MPELQINLILDGTKNRRRRPKTTNQLVHQAWAERYIAIPKTAIANVAVTAKLSDAVKQSMQVPTISMIRQRVE